MKKLLMGCVLICGASCAMAAEDKPVAQFKTSLSIGAALTGGNSETMNANGALVTEGEKVGLGSVRAGLEAKYGENTVAEVTETAVENARVFGNVKKTFSPLTFGYVDGSVMYDSIADVDYRATLGPGLGAYLLKDERVSLSAEGGASYVWEKVAGESDDYLALRVGERITYALGPTAKLWQSAEYLPRADDFGDYLLSAELGAESALSSRVNMKLVLQDKYDSTPAEGMKNNDVSLIAGVSVSL